MVALLGELSFGLPGWRAVAARPRPLECAWRGHEAVVRATPDDAGLAVPAAAWCRFVDQVFAAIGDALRPPGLTAAQERLLFATVNVHPARCVFEGVDRTPVPWRRRGGPGLLDAFVAQDAGVEAERALGLERDGVERLEAIDQPDRVGAGGGGPVVEVAEPGGGAVPGHDEPVDVGRAQPVGELRRRPGPGRRRRDR